MSRLCTQMSVGYARMNATIGQTSNILFCYQRQQNSGRVPIKLTHASKIEYPQLLP